MPLRSPLAGTSPAPFPAVGLAGLIAAALGTVVACIPQIPRGDVPVGEEALADAAVRECEPEFEDFADIAYEDSELDYW